MPPPRGETSGETYHPSRKLRKAGLAAAVAAGALAWVRWRPFRVEVRGESMSPALGDGDWALAVGTRRVGRGDVVVLEHPARPGFELVKRAVAGPGDRAPDGSVLGPGHWWVEGDSGEASTDSRSFGPIDARAIRGRVVLRWWPRVRIVR